MNVASTLTGLAVELLGAGGWGVHKTQQIGEAGEIRERAPLDLGLVSVFVCLFF